MPGASWAWDIVALVEQMAAGVITAAYQKLVAKVKVGDGFDLDDFEPAAADEHGRLAGLMDKLPTQMAAKAGQVDMTRLMKQGRHHPEHAGLKPEPPSASPTDIRRGVHVRYQPPVQRLAYGKGMMKR
jgi:hypothetical protein